MSEEITETKEIIKENSNCIVKAFEEHPIFIFSEEIENKKQYLFKASDVATVLGLTNIRQVISNFDEDEVRVCKVYTNKGERIANFLTSRGVYFF